MLAAAVTVIPLAVIPTLDTALYVSLIYLSNLFYNPLSIFLRAVTIQY